RNLKGWLFTIMRNHFYSELRARKRRRISIEDTGPPAAADNPEASVELKELAAALWRLSPSARESLILVGAGGFSYEEAANLCSCSVGTMKARVSRARRRLMLELRGDED